MNPLGFKRHFQTLRNSQLWNRLDVGRIGKDYLYNRC